MICCENWKKAHKQGTDADGNGPLIRKGEEAYMMENPIDENIGQGLPAVYFCPWCGAHVSKSPTWLVPSMRSGQVLGLLERDGDLRKISGKWRLCLRDDCFLFGVHTRVLKGDPWGFEVSIKAQRMLDDPQGVFAFVKHSVLVAWDEWRKAVAGKLRLHFGV